MSLGSTFLQIPSAFSLLFGEKVRCWNAEWPDRMSECLNLAVEFRGQRFLKEMDKELLRPHFSMRGLRSGQACALQMVVVLTIQIEADLIHWIVCRRNAICLLARNLEVTLLKKIGAWLFKLQFQNKCTFFHRREIYTTSWCLKMREEHSNWSRG